MTLARNITASVVARVWAVALQILLTPVIVRLLGPDSYGLVAFSSAVSMFLVFLDSCVSPALARELARSGPVAAMTATQATDMRNLLRTLEVVSGAMALVVGGAVVLAAPWIARHGLAAGRLPEATITTAIRLIGVTIALQWPAMLYSGGCIGLQRQDILVAIRLVIGTLQAFGTVLLLWKVSSAIEVYLGWMALTSGLTSAIVGIALWRIMPAVAQPGGASGRPRIVFDHLLGIWRFAAGSLLIGLTSALLTQGPGLIVAKFCSLSQLAAYSLSMSLAQQVTSILTAPVIGTLVPHFTHLMAAGDQSVLAREYHRWTQIIMALVLPVAATLIVFARPLMELWLGRDAPLVAPVSALLPWIVAGTVLNTIATPPYLLQMARGWTRLLVIMNSLVVAVMLPTLVLLVPRYGPMAVAAFWIVINFGYVIFYAPAVHRRLLPEVHADWSQADTLLPTGATMLVYLVIVAVLPDAWSAWPKLGCAIAASGLAWCLLLAVLPHFRADALRMLQSTRRLVGRCG